ncbi:MAG: hypothetical protein H7288_00470 [Kineosporiaceae bacterium]|nr:hypothetical protein [Aeromicrobium sp.]
MKIPSSRLYEGFGMLKGVEPVPWGRPRGSFLYPWYMTWVTFAAGAVVFLVVTPLMLLTSERWLAFVGLAFASVFVIDAVATTMIVFLRNRRKKRPKRS